MVVRIAYFCVSDIPFGRIAPGRSMEHATSSSSEPWDGDLHEPKELSATIGRQAVERLTALLLPWSVTPDNAAIAIFFEAGRLSAEQLGRPGQLSLSIMLMAIGAVAVDFVSDAVESATFGPIAQVLGKARVLSGAPFMFSERAEFGLPHELILLPEMEQLVAKCGELAALQGRLSVGHLLAGFAGLPEATVASALHDIGADQKAFEALIDIQIQLCKLEVPPDQDTAASVPPPSSGPTRAFKEAVQTELVTDDPEVERDAFGRTVLAIGLARRLHRIWVSTNRSPGASPQGEAKSAFVIQLDAPWGGGKTTFGNFVAAVLNPGLGCQAGAADFLERRYPGQDVGGIFLDDPPADDTARAQLAAEALEARRPWIIVPFNAWRCEHCLPPWWVFYKMIRRTCFRSVLREGTQAWTPERKDRRARKGSPRRAAWGAYARLWFAEIRFRLTNPKITLLLLTALVSMVSLGFMDAFGFWVRMVDAKGTATSGFALSTGVGLLLSGITGISFIWALGALVAEAIMPGNNSVTERLSLGGGDPFERFRHHFDATMRRVKRPVLVVIDDLDRCNPAFIVDLIRGVQTVLRSSRVMFMILGDREWIEAAFEAHYSAMSSLDVGPEQSLGARFVEKAIQMSFILPKPSHEDQAIYLRNVLLGGGALDPVAVSTSELRMVREMANTLSAQGGNAPFDSTPIVDKAMEALQVTSSRTMGEPDLRQRVEQVVNDALAINVTVDHGAESEIVHQLEALAGCFPTNPRQVKRIVNAITLYYAVALQRPGLDPDMAFRRQLTIWVILMTERPATWKLLASCPDLIDAIIAGEPGAVLDALGSDRLPGSLMATRKRVEQVRSDPILRLLIGGHEASGHSGLTVPTARILAELTPLHHSMKRLEEAE